jgi:hypothetical protein
VRRIWTILCVLALANLLALGGFAGWLKSSGRIDMARVRQVRQLFSESVAQQQAREAEAAAKADVDAKAAEEKVKAAQPPIGAADALSLKLEQGKADQERLESLKREVQILQETLKRERNQLEADKAQLAKDRAEFERARQAVAQTEGNTQFKKALATLEGLKPDKAKTTLQQLIETKQVDQVVSYLNAMQERTRTKVLDEFIKADPKVATDLLERLRTRGLASRAPETAPG